MNSKRKDKLVRKCAKAMARAAGVDPNALTFPTPKVIALMRDGRMAPSIRVYAWRNFVTSSTQTVDDLLLNPEIAPLLGSGKVKWKFDQEEVQ